MSKLSSARFLAALCEEYVRLESVLDDAVPGLFKEHDADFSGYLDRSGHHSSFYCFCLCTLSCRRLLTSI